MAKGGFWDYQDYWGTVTSGSFWFDAEWKQRRDLNDLDAAGQAVRYDVQSLSTALAQAQKQMLELSMTVVVMAQMLQEAGHLDLDAMHARIDTELEKLRPKAPPPLEAHPAKPHPLDTPVLCTKCGKMVPASRTTITEAGTVCDNCAT